MKITTVEVGRGGSDPKHKLTVHDKINIRVYLQDRNIKWMNCHCYGYRHAFGVSFAVRDIITGEITD